MKLYNTNISGIKDRNERLSLIIKNIEKKFGKGALMKLTSRHKFSDLNVSSTGSISLDIITGIGGYPLGRIVEIYGPESSGKTTLGLHAIAENQKNGGIAAFIDVEHALDITYAKKLGVVIEDLLISQPDNGEQALEIISIICQSKSVNIIVVDSVAALIPQSEIDGDIQDVQIGLQARLMSKALRKLISIIYQSPTSIIFINQIRMKIGIMFGSPETTTGGYALKFYSSVRLEIKRIGVIKKNYEFIGSRTKIKISKNKMASPFREVEVDILYGLGISKEGEIIDLGLRTKIILKRGHWLIFNNINIGHGREDCRQRLTNNFLLRNIVHNQLFNNIFYKIETYRLNKLISR